MIKSSEYFTCCCMSGSGVSRKPTVSRTFTDLLPFFHEKKKRNKSFNSWVRRHLLAGTKCRIDGTFLNNGEDSNIHQHLQCCAC